MKKEHLVREWKRFEIANLTTVAAVILILTHGRRNRGGGEGRQKISRGGQGGRFLGEKTSSFNQYRTMLVYIPIAD